MPNQRLPLHFDHNYSTGNLAQLGSYAFATSITLNGTGGWYAHPVTTPLNMDRSRIARLFVWVFNPGAPVTPSGVVRLTASYTLSRPGVTALDFPKLHLLTIPDLQPQNQPLLVEFRPGGLPYLEAGLLQPDSILGIQVARAGAHASDTWTGTLGILNSAYLEYSENCLASCM